MKKLLYYISIIFLILVFSSCSTIKNDSSFTIAIAWRNDINSDSYTKVFDYLMSTGANVVLLEKTATDDLTYYSDGTLSDDWINYDFSLSEEASDILWNTNSIIAPDNINDIDLIVFTGGEDISPTLYGKSYLLDEAIYSPERDVSDFLTMKYALNNSIPVLGICRGMQMLAIAEGATLIEDLPEYFLGKNITEYEDIYRHRKEDGSYNFHNIEISEDSFLADIVKLPVASSHHQAVNTEEKGDINILAWCDGVIEAIDINKDSLAIGIQFHPEYYITNKEDEWNESIALLNSIIDMID